MQLSPEQQKILEEQKKQCIFCQIIEGKIPTKKVYEDELVIAILDIHPASKGHILMMPKEHYPIMPLIPPETFKHMMSKVRAVEQSVKEAMLCKETTVFVANGGAAGQQSAHFMIHIIPREGGDGLEAFDMKGGEAPEEEVKEVVEKAGPMLNAMLNRNLPALGFTEQSGSGAGGAEAETGAEGAGQESGGTASVPHKISKEQLLQIINSNPQVKQLILEKPEQFKQIVPTHPQLKQLFKDVEIDDIIEEVKKKTKPKEQGKLDLEGSLKDSGQGGH